MEKRVKWGVIGAGGIADRRAIPGLMQTRNAELTALMDVDARRLGELGRKYPMAEPFSDAVALLESPRVDAVYIATPVFRHLEQVRAAAERGKHVLVEKPIGLDAREAEAATQACADRNVKLGVGLMMRYGALHRRFRELIAAGRLGTIVSARAQFSCWYPDMPGAWRQDPALSGGGALMDLGVHAIDLIEHITGLQTKAVSAFIGTHTFKYHSDDSAVVLLELSNGAPAVSESFFSIPDAAGAAPLEFYGTRGSILARGTLAQDDKGEALLTAASDQAAYNAAQRGAEPKAEVLSGAFGNLYAREIESFSRSILHGEPVEVPGEDGVRLQRVIDAAYESAKTGRKITLS